MQQTVPREPRRRMYNTADLIKCDVAYTWGVERRCSEHHFFWKYGLCANRTVVPDHPRSSPRLLPKASGRLSLHQGERSGDSIANGEVILTVVTAAPSVPGKVMQGDGKVCSVGLFFSQRLRRRAPRASFHMDHQAHSYWPKYKVLQHVSACHEPLTYLRTPIRLLTKFPVTPSRAGIERR